MTFSRHVTVYDDPTLAEVAMSRLYGSINIYTVSKVIKEDVTHKKIQKNKINKNITFGRSTG